MIERQAQYEATQYERSQHERTQLPSRPSIAVSATRSTHGRYLSPLTACLSTHAATDRALATPLSSNTVTATATLTYCTAAHTRSTRRRYNEAR